MTEKLRGLQAKIRKLNEKRLGIVNEIRTLDRDIELLKREIEREEILIDTTKAKEVGLIGKCFKYIDEAGSLHNSEYTKIIGIDKDGEVDLIKLTLQRVFRREDDTRCSLGKYLSRRTYMLSAFSSYLNGEGGDTKHEISQEEFNKALKCFMDEMGMGKEELMERLDIEATKTVEYTKEVKTKIGKVMEGLD